MDIRPALESLRQQIPFIPELAIVLGSGLGTLADYMEAKTALTINFRDLPGFPDQSVPGHSGKLIFCELEKKNIVLQAGRFHYYEGHPMSLVTAPMRVYGRLRVKAVLLTNAAGAVNPGLKVGSLMVIRDHINLQGINPLIGPNIEPGARFPDMTFLYDPKLRQQLLSAGGRHNQEIFEGVYVAVTGPSFETPAEIKAFHLLGGDAVGMSTAPEAIVARHEGMRVAGISCICNMGAGILEETTLTHQEVLDMSNTIGKSFEQVIREFVRNLDL
ncbi:MAG: purine-nucleoside phosphorylase [Holophagales bacterium]|jgi:purine-nucleoside phosphorylase|nr:purine-nucleoside phosphorylase [Holophagales bacterium]